MCSVFEVISCSVFHTEHFVKCSSNLVKFFHLIFLLVYEIRLGTIDQADAADVEWVNRPYMNTAKKRKYLSIE